MSANLFTRSTLAITGAVFSLGAVAINPANAARITYDFSMETYGPDGYTPLTGRFSYDDATESKHILYEYIEGEGEPQWGVFLYESKGYKVDVIEFSFLDKVYTQADAISPISFWMDYANNEKIGTGLYWETEDFVFRGWGYRMEAIGTAFYRKTSDGLIFEQTVNFFPVPEEPTSVPEPSILAAFSVVGLAGLLRKKRIKAQLPD
ncbi:PEP-CTERM sorting domain-containing protein [Laspinema olomoucense]|uniref:PEP-CTERM sorting domain-containing protein n=1 Tax=Laspinema olomoucense TaxID=3231600 RepID=UPI0021BB78D7|nr:PEP-CTERM sorting domain-containing protein [Laspinema sp. D3a]MCT7991564.1 PEP-CTERM sorting domain-containing protein [Laspinema sp. D3a]